MIILLKKLAGIGGNGMTALAIIGIGAALLVYDQSRVATGAATERAKQVKVTHERIDEGRAAARRAREPGSFDRLRRSWCADCK